MRLLIQALALAIVLAAGETCGAQCTEPRQGAKPVLSITAIAVQDTIKLGSPVLLKVNMTNKSDHDISLWIATGGGEDQYEVEVHDESGNLRPDTEFGKKRNGHVDVAKLKPQDLTISGACVTLKAGKSLVHQVDISRLYDLNAPGRYSIRVQKADPESLVMAKANAVTVTITP